MGKLNSTSLLSQKEGERIRRERDAKTVFGFIFVLLYIYFGFGVYRILTKTGFDQLIGFFELFLVVFLIVNAFLYRRHHRADIIKPIMSSLTGILCLLLLVSGGTSGTGIFWSVVLQSTNSHFLGRRVGAIFSFIFTMAFMAIGFGAMYTDLLSVPYSTPEIVQGVIVLTVVFLLADATRKAYDEYERGGSRQRDQMRVLLENIPAGIILIVPPIGRPTVVNSTLEKMLGQDVEDNLDLQQFVDWAHMTREDNAPLPAEETPLGIALKSGNEASEDGVFIMRPDGSSIVTRLAAAPIKDASGKTVSVVGIFEDMTKQHEADQMKTELVSLASHQMKTPMTAIKWTVESLLDGDAGKMTEDQVEFTKPILEIIERMTGFINDLLSVSRIDSGRKFDIHPTPTDVIPILQSVIREQKTTADSRQVEVALELPESLLLMADGVKFREVFMNLISNAIKYSKDGGRVTVRLENSLPTGKTLIVEDGGIGIPADQHKNIFKRFFRASNIDDEIEGTGLGLYIAKEIVDRHGGYIWFESEEGKGTSFFVGLKPAPNGK